MMSRFSLRAETNKSSLITIGVPLAKPEISSLFILYNALDSCRLCPVLLAGTCVARGGLTHGIQFVEDISWKQLACFLVEMISRNVLHRC